MPEGTRLFYIGLWMTADDAGWFRWNPVEVAADLYRYETRTRRERRSSEMFARLTDAGRVVLHPCGHAEIPTMTVHQRLSGPTKQVQTSLNEHLRSCHTTPPAIPRVSPQVPADPRPERNGTDVEPEMERNVVGTGKGSGRAREAAAPAENEPESEFRKRVGLVNIS